MICYAINELSSSKAFLILGEMADRNIRLFYSCRGFILKEEEASTNIVDASSFIMEFLKKLISKFTDEFYSD